MPCKKPYWQPQTSLCTHDLSLRKKGEFETVPGRNSCCCALKTNSTLAGTIISVAPGQVSRVRVNGSKQHQNLTIARRGYPRTKKKHFTWTSRYCLNQYIKILLSLLVPYRVSPLMGHNQSHPKNDLGAGACPAEALRFCSVRKTVSKP
eukprot:1462380-Rhodomonas_salina.2